MIYTLFAKTFTKRYYRILRVLLLKKMRTFTKYHAFGQAGERVTSDAFGQTGESIHGATVYTKVWPKALVDQVAECPEDVDNLIDNFPVDIGGCM